MLLSSWVISFLLLLIDDHGSGLIVPHLQKNAGTVVSVGIVFPKIRNPARLNLRITICLLVNYIDLETAGIKMPLRICILIWRQV